MKKGQIGYRLMGWILIRSVLLIIVILAVKFASASFIQRDIDNARLEGYLISSRIFYGDGCILFNDGSRELPGVIDLSKLNQAVLENCYDISTDKKGFRVSLFGFDGEDRVLIREIKVNEDLANDEVFCEGRSELKCVNYERYVIYYDGYFNRGVLEVSSVLRI
jgi:hypothetical protein